MKKHEFKICMRQGASNPHTVFKSFLMYHFLFHDFMKNSYYLSIKKIEDISVVRRNEYAHSELISTHCVGPLKKYVFLPLKSS